MSIGSRIRQAREARHLKQGELAKAIGIAQASLSLLESGRSASPKGTTLTELARVLHVEPSWILTGRGPMTSDEQQKPDQPEILQIWQALGRAKRAALLAAARALRDSDEDDSSPYSGPDRRTHIK